MSLYRAPEVFCERGFLWPLDVPTPMLLYHAPKYIIWIQNMVVRNGPHIIRISNIELLKMCPIGTALNVNGVDLATKNHIEAHIIS